jgi:dTDP-4-amino-4,6-dideoxygalactose transaminase
MIWRALPPAGNPILLSSKSSCLPMFEGYRPVWLNSGTAALALALMMCRRRHPEISHPEVVLPAYACPDLAAAAVYTGVRPVLADIHAEDPGLDLTSLRMMLSPNTIGVVAVNFLGIRERLPELRNLLKEWPAAALIEDDAQWYPEGSGCLQGDLVCLSFGRGKPASLLGGGALLVREGLTTDAAAEVLSTPTQARIGSLQWKLRAYNALLNPFFYALLRRTPFLRLGHTVFRPLENVASMDRDRQNLLGANVDRYIALSRAAAERIHAMLPRAMDLPGRLADRSGRLLRYPVLCESMRQRNALWAELNHAGLGASAMYQRPLYEIDRIPDCVRVGTEFPGARRFSERLLTLPVHCAVATADIQRIGEILRRTSAS